MSADLDGKPERTDVVNVYRLALGRDPESAAVVGYLAAALSRIEGEIEIEIVSGAGVRGWAADRGPPFTRLQPPPFLRR